MNERSIFGECQVREPNPIHPAEARATTGDPMHGLFGARFSQMRAGRRNRGSASASFPEACPDPQ